MSRWLCLALSCLASVSFIHSAAFADDGMKHPRIYAVYWRGCEESCQGYRDYLEAHMPGAELIIRDAARDRDRLPGFLEEARAFQPDLLLSWGTTVTLALAGTLSDLGNTAFNHELPQIFTLVADPVGAGIIKSLDETGRANLTGTLNRVPEEVNINAMRTYLPSFKRLGLIYNRNERNSVLKKEELEALAPKMGFELVALELALDSSGVPLAADIPDKLTQLKQLDVDFIYLGSSSFLNEQSSVFTSSAVEVGLPVLSPYESQVRESDALMSVSARYYQVGELAGELTLRIIKDGVEPGSLPVARMTEFAYVVNMDVARRLNLFPSVEILQFAETVKN
ncbi:MAG: ABC transporter substrate-binding protein [Oceanospirillales bacterium]|nr:ABC transporter substrate-binding protein [Oceanospirillales bacterium]